MTIIADFESKIEDYTRARARIGEFFSSPQITHVIKSTETRIYLINFPAILNSQFSISRCLDIDVKISMYLDSKDLKKGKERRLEKNDPRIFRAACLYERKRSALFRTMKSFSSWSFVAIESSSPSSSSSPSVSLPALVQRRHSLPLTSRSCIVGATDWTKEERPLTSLPKNGNRCLCLQLVTVIGDSVLA